MPDSAGAKATPRAFDACSRSSPIMFIENASQWDERATLQSLSSNQTPRNGNASDSKKVKLVGQLGGVTCAVAEQRNCTYLGVGPRLVILNIADSASGERRPPSRRMRCRRSFIVSTQTMKGASFGLWRVWPKLLFGCLIE